jgi:hypothetical protein
MFVKNGFYNESLGAANQINGGVTEMESTSADSATGAPVLTSTSTGSTRTISPSVVLPLDYSALYAQAATKVEKVAVLVTVCKEIKASLDSGHVLRPPLKDFAYKANRVVDCVFRCHAGSSSSFIDATTDFQLKKYTCSTGKKHTAGFKNVLF